MLNYLTEHRWSNIEWNTNSFRVELFFFQQSVQITFIFNNKYTRYTINFKNMHFPKTFVQSPKSFSMKKENIAMQIVCWKSFVIRNFEKNILFEEYNVYKEVKVRKREISDAEFDHKNMYYKVSYKSRIILEFKNVTSIDFINNGKWGNENPIFYTVGYLFCFFAYAM